MRTQSLGLVAALAMDASARLIATRLIITPMNPIALHSVAVAPPAEKIEPKLQYVKMSCPGCEFALGRLGQVPNSLLLQFRVADNGHELELNHQPAYPKIRFPPAPLKAIQMPTSGNIEHILKAHCHSRMIDVNAYSWKWHPSKVESDGTEIVEGLFTVKAVQGKPVTVPSMSITLSKDSEGTITIISIKEMPLEPEEPEPSMPSLLPSSSEPCAHGGALFCRLRSIFKAHIVRFRIAFRVKCKKPRVLSIHKLLPGEIPAGLFSDKPSKALVVAHPDHYDHHKHHRNIKGFAHVLAKGAKVVVLPMLIGVAAGFLVYVIGMAAGLIVAFSWSFVRRWRGRRRGVYVVINQRLDQSTESLDYADMDKTAYQDDEEFSDSPPLYQTPVARSEQVE